jgi:hypothetical protein
MAREPVALTLRLGRVSALLCEAEFRKNRGKRRAGVLHAAAVVSAIALAAIAAVAYLTLRHEMLDEPVGHEPWEAGVG